MLISDQLADNQVSYDRLRQIVAAATPTPDWHSENRSFYNGDHLQQGAGWIGPGPGPQEAGYAEFIARLKDVFVFQNEIKKRVDTKVNAVIGRPPAWGATVRRVLTKDAPLSDGESNLIAEHDALLTTWWDKKRVHGVLQEFGRLYELTGRAMLRIFLPETALDAAGRVPPGDVATCLSRLYVEAVGAQQGRVWTEPRTMRQVGLYLFKREEEVSNETGELETRLQDQVELTYLDAGGRTILKVLGRAYLRADGTPDPAHSPQPEQAAPLDLGGNLWHFEVEGEALVGDAVRALQRMLNLAWNVGRKNAAENGWAEEFLLNAQLEGKFVQDEDGKKRFIPDPIRRGPNVSRVIQGREIEKGDGATNFVPADVKWREPVSPETSLMLIEGCKDAIAEETSQAHTRFTSSDANSSGEALKQKRADFTTSLERSATLINQAGLWLLETVLAIAVAHSGGVNPYAELRETFACRLNAGPRTADERMEDREQVKEGLLSRETAMTRDDIDDVDAEAARIDDEAARSLDGQQTRATTFKVFTDAGVEAKAAAEVAGFTDDQIALLGQKAPAPAPVVVPPAPPVAPPAPVVTS